MNTLRRYQTSDGKDIVGDWLAALKDIRARARIQIRLDRLEAGNPGDCVPAREGVHEMRINYGPGYRVYFCNMGRQIVLLLCGGDKTTQHADIKQAIAYKHDFEERTK